MTTTHTAQPHAASSAPGAVSDARQLVSFSFYHVDPAWRRQAKDVRKKQAQEFLDAATASAKQLMTLTFSLTGLKAQADFMIWRVGSTLEQLQAASARLQQTALAGYLTTPYHYLSMTKRSTYVDKLDPEHPEQRRFIRPFHRKYLFVYPFVKTTAWYMLPFEQRQAMMDEHIVLGNKYPSVRIHTTYAFGLDDPEFVLAFETDSPQDFLDLV
ncbi:MAG: chlorite dismutase family protein, partial [Candidatus Omnitrophica bacterium]|nr:chlorite dismutase family protein [Candidatus Omnitrophota bacterium]